MHELANALYLMWFASIGIAALLVVGVTSLVVKLVKGKKHG